MNFFCRKKKTNYGKIAAITVACVAGACAVAFFLFKLYEKYVAHKLVLDDNCVCDADCDCNCDECECECVCDDAADEVEAETVEAEAVEAEDAE